MIIPSRCMCDFCNTEIPEGRLVVKIQLPIPPSVRRELIDHVGKELPQRFASSPLSAIGFSAEMFVPSTWTLEICVGCAHGIFPDVNGKIIEQIRDVMRRQAIAKRRNIDAGEELEPAGEGGR